MIAKSVKDQNVCIGVITSVNGVRGNVRIRIFTQNPSDIGSFNNVFDPLQNRSFKIKIITCKKDYVIASIEGITNRNQAEELRNTMLYINRSELPTTSNSDEFYHSDLVGLEVRYQDGVKVGIIKNVLNFGAGDIIEIADISSEKTIYYPFTKAFVPTINLEGGYLTVIPLEETVATAE